MGRGHVKDGKGLESVGGKNWRLLDYDILRGNAVKSKNKLM